MPKTEREIGARLLTERGLHLLYGHGGDLLAVLLRAEDLGQESFAARVRAEPRLHRSRTGAWVTGEHLLGAQVLRDPRFGTEDLAWSPVPVLEPLPPARYERLVTQLRGAAETARAGAVADRTGRRLAGLGAEFDLTTDLVRPVAVDLVCALLDVSGANQAEVAADSHRSGIALDAVLCPPRLPDALALVAGVAGLREAFAGPDTDATTAAVLTVGLGVELITTLVGNAVLALLGHVEHWRALAASPELAASVVEETLRHDSPVRAEVRVAGEAVEIEGRRIGAGERMVILVGAANRDPAAFHDPHRFDPHRTDASRQLCLFPGGHSGVVGELVRASATALLPVLAAELPSLHRSGAVVRRLRCPITGSIAQLPVAR
jgi:P450-derived glycosyltransferase activator